MRYAGRRSGQQSRKQDEEYGEDRPIMDEGMPMPRAQDNDSVVADLAKSLVEAQTKMAVASGGNADKAMLAMLEKISRQLEELRQPPNASQAAESSAGGGEQQDTAAKGASAGANDLAALFSKLLQEGGTSCAKAAGGNSQGQGAAAGAQGQGQAVGGKTGGGQGQGQGQKQGDAATTAAQLLAQAQYELANELESSLTKLKQVIDESEKLADKISNLLGQEDGQNSS